MEQWKITDIVGIEVGQAQDLEAGTGCSVIVCREGAICGVDVRGGAPATRETDLLRPENTVQKVNAILLTGGSAFGLDAASGVMAYLEAADCGFETGYGKVPIVCAAACFDLSVGRPDVRPGFAMGFEACEDAARQTNLDQGDFGGGTGASVGKLRGNGRAMKSGVGTAGMCLGNLQVAALTVVNAVGTVVDDEGKALAGVVSRDGKRVLSPEESFEELIENPIDPFAGNTTISCIVTNASLTKAQATKIASTCHDAYARCIRPVHTSNDGDTIFVLATGAVPVSQDTVGIIGTAVLEQAIRNAVLAAEPAYGLASARTFR